jgi:hypothetical protein
VAGGWFEDVDPLVTGVADELPSDVIAQVQRLLSIRIALTRDAA